MVLRDDGTGKAFDDPDGRPGNTYVTVLGSIIASGELVKWGTTELAAYLAAMVAEWHDPMFDQRQGARRERPLVPPGLLVRQRPPPRPPRAHPLLGDDVGAGFKRLTDDGLIAKDRRLKDSATGRRFRTGRRNVYTNRFAILNEVVRAQTIGSEQFDAELRQLVDANSESAAPGRDA